MYGSLMLKYSLLAPSYTEEVLAVNRCWGRKNHIFIEDMATGMFLMLQCVASYLRTYEQHQLDLVGCQRDRYEIGRECIERIWGSLEGRRGYI